MKVIGNLEIMGQRSIIQFNTAPASNHEYSGWISQEFVDENVTVGQVLCFNHDTQRWKLAKADSASTMPGRAIALDNIGSGMSGNLLRFGTLRLDSQNFDQSFIYVSATTAGALSTTAPTTSGSIVQKIGTPVKNNVGWFDFNAATSTVA